MAKKKPARKSTSKTKKKPVAKKKSKKKAAKPQKAAVHSKKAAPKKKPHKTAGRGVEIEVAEVELIGEPEDVADDEIFPPDYGGSE
jgi:hypothetical protein